MGDSPSADSDESLEVQERFDDQSKNKFGGNLTNLSDPSEAQGFAGSTPVQQALTQAAYTVSQRNVADKARRGEIEGVNLQPSTQDVQDFAREQDFFDANPMSTAVDAPFTSRSGEINVGAGDVTGLKEQIARKLSQGGKPVTNQRGEIVGATGQTSLFGIPFLPNVTTYTGRNEFNPFGDPTIGSDDNNEPQIIRAANPRDAVEETEETRPPVSDDLAVNYLQDPFYLYSGQGNLFQPYGYAQNTLVDLLRTRNLTQPTQAAANLGLFGNPGDFV